MKDEADSLVNTSQDQFHVEKNGKFYEKVELFSYNINNSNFFSTQFLSKTLSSKKRKKSSQIPCIGPLFVLNYYGAVKNSY